MKQVVEVRITGEGEMFLIVGVGEAFVVGDPASLNTVHAKLPLGIAQAQQCLAFELKTSTSAAVIKSPNRAIISRHFSRGEVVANVSDQKAPVIRNSLRLSAMH